MIRDVLDALLNEYRPPPRAPAELHALRPAAPLRPGQTIRLLCWNLQFAGSRDLHFFYDGGPSARVSRWRAERITRGIRDVICEIAPDIALLQEVDRFSDRTGRWDQARCLTDSGGWAAWASAPYFRSAYVPHPPGAHLGRIDMHLQILSRHPILSAERIALPLLDEPRLRQAFNLKRAILGAALPIEGAPPLRLGNTHLSAFSFGDGTLEKQVAVVDQWMDDGAPWILGGDFNLLPPGDDPSRVETPEHYADDRNPIERLLPARQEAAPDPLAPSARTFLPFGADTPERKIDYVFAGGVEILAHEVLQDVRLSDHLPMVVTLRLPG